MLYNFDHYLDAVFGKPDTPRREALAFAINEERFNTGPSMSYFKELDDDIKRLKREE